MFDHSKYCIDMLFKKIPEISKLEGELKEQLDYCIENDFGSYIYYENVFVYFLVDILKKISTTEQDKELLSRCFQFIEELSSHENFEVRCLSKVGIIESLLDKIKPTRDIEKYLGPNSLQLAKESAWDHFGIDFRIGWQKAKEWHYGYSKYFGMIANKPETGDLKLQEIYNKLYKDSDPIPGGIAQMLKETSKQGRRFYKSEELLKKASSLLTQLTARIENKDNPLPEYEEETAVILMLNLRDSINLVKASQ